MLSSLLKPRGVAIVGASDDLGKLRGKLLHVLRAGGYGGAIYPVNPGREVIQGLPAYPDIAALPTVPDLVMVAVPGFQVGSVLRAAQAAGVAAAVVFSADVDASALREVSGAGGMRVVGPNTEGFFFPAGKLAATFAPVIEHELAAVARPAWPGRPIAIVSQSGGLGFALYGRLTAAHLPIAGVYTTGNEADLDCLDFVEHLVDEGEVGVILMFIEGIKNPGRLPAVAARAAAKHIPIVTIKVGQSEAGQRAALSHTAHLAGTDAAYDATFARHGIMRVLDQEEIVAAAAAFSRLPRGIGRRVAVVTTSGGAGAWAADLCASFNVELPETDSATAAAIAAIIPGFGATGNPIDVTAQAVEDGGATLVRVLDILCASDCFDAVIVNMGLAKVGRIEGLRAMLKPLLDRSAKPILFHSHILPDEGNLRALAALGGHGFASLRSCAAALHLLDCYRVFQQSLRPAASSALVPPCLVIERGTGVLDEAQTSQVLGAYAVPLPPSHLASDGSDALAAAHGMGFPVVLKIQSPDIPHKTESGGVALGVQAPDLLATHELILARAMKAVPGARIEGVLVQKMMPPGHEVVVGVVNDSDFGPLVMLGAGGIYVEILRDVVFAPPPIDLAEAHRMIRALKTAPILLGARGRPPADIDALAGLLVSVARLAVEQTGVIDQLDLNPVFVYAQGEGVIAVDALLTFSETAQRGQA